MSERPKVRILVVDDDADVRESLKLALKLEGYSVATARNGLEALARSPVDILITDIFMPEADGFETIEAFRKIHPTTRVIVLSGGAPLIKTDYLAVARMIGVDVTLQKPIDPLELSRTILELMKDADRH